MESIFGNISTFTGPPDADYTINDDEALYDTIPAGQTKSCSQWETVTPLPCRFPISGDPRTGTPCCRRELQSQPGSTLGDPPRRELPRRADRPPVLSVHRDPLPQRRHHRLCRRRLLPRGSRHSRADGGLPAQVQVRLRPRPAAVHRHRLHRRALHRRRFDPWIEELAALEITGGCGGRTIAPATPSRASRWRSFCSRLWKARRTTHPIATGIFDDVTCTPGTGFSDWIEELYNRGDHGWLLHRRRSSTARPTRTTAARWRSSS